MTQLVLYNKIQRERGESTDHNGIRNSHNSDNRVLWSK